MFMRHLFFQSMALRAVSFTQDELPHLRERVCTLCHIVQPSLHRLDEGRYATKTLDFQGSRFESEPDAGSRSPQGVHTNDAVVFQPV
jgi:hypothetical protein